VPDARIGGARAGHRLAFVTESVPVTVAAAVPGELLAPSPRPSTRVALALGSGGARGYAHIGVLQVLEERGFDVVAIAGSSMGALVGGLRAAGTLGDYTEWALGLNQFDVLRLLDPSITSAGAIKAEKVFARLREMFGDVQIEDLAVPFTAVATDLLSGKEVWFQRGPLATAIRASVAIPSVITPVMLNGRLLADGGLMNPLPIAPTVSAHADATVAVSLAGDRTTPAAGPPAGESAAERPVEEWGDRFRRTAANLLDREVIRSIVGRLGRGTDVHTVDADGFEELPAGLSKGDVIAQSLDAMQSVLTRYRLAGYPPDVLISVPRDACRTLDFHRAAEVIDLGRHLAEQALDAAGLTSTRR